MIILNRFIFLIIILSSYLCSFGKVILPAIFSDNMVLQQKSKAAIWGWANPGERVSVMASWSNKNISTVTNTNGEWKMLLNTPVAGGPFTLRVSGENTIDLKNVLIGEVWICSGQSNMVMSLKASDKGKEESTLATFPGIRYFNVKRQYGLNEFNDAKGSVWVLTSPENAPSFSAVSINSVRNASSQPFTACLLAL
jgi:sialate O-acetylesterase